MLYYSRCLLKVLAQNLTLTAGNCNIVIVSASGKYDNVSIRTLENNLVIR